MRITCVHFANLRQTLQLSIKPSGGCDEESEPSQKWERFVPGLISNKGAQPDCLQGSCHSSYTNGEETGSSVARLATIALNAMQFSVPPYYATNFLTIVHCDKFDEYFGHFPFLCLLKEIGCLAFFRWEQKLGSWWVGTIRAILSLWTYQADSCLAESTE